MLALAKSEMAFVNKLSLSSFSSPNTKLINPINPKTIICSLHFKTSSFSSSSPFTEKHSLERYQRDQWIYSNLQQQKPLEPTSCSVSEDNEDSIRQDDIELQLPELKKLLDVLREKREIKCCGDGREDKCGPGDVYLVGTGPGDPELLTLKAMRVIQKADLLLYDRLVSNDVLDLVSQNTRLLYVGKTAGYHSRTQVTKIITFSEFLVLYAEFVDWSFDPSIGFLLWIGFI